MRICALLSALMFATLPAAADEQKLTLAAPPGQLHGTLLSAGKDAPAVLIIAGSGPTDRDGNAPAAGLRSDMYKLLGEGLAAKNIASLRTDKRGVGESRDAMTSEADLRIQTYADDVKSWATKLREQTGTRCVWLMGHSEGALLAEIAAQDDAGICGLVLISGAGRKPGDILREQFQQAMPEALRPVALSVLAELEAGRTVADPPAQLAALFRPSVQPYLISWLKPDPAALLSKIKRPVLILQGDTDIQVSVADAKLLAAAQPDAKLTVLAGVNHILKLAPADRAANVATYADPSLPLAPGVVDAVADFVHEHRP
jgi:pimeloyl-ACP methyl ester carboxylesterase